MFSKYTIYFLVLLIGIALSLPIEVREPNVEETTVDDAGDQKSQAKQAAKPKNEETSGKRAYTKVYGDEDDSKENEKGFTRKAHEKGSKGHKGFDSFERKRKDKYGYETHSSFGKYDTGSAENSNAKSKAENAQPEAAETNSYVSYAHPESDDHGIPHFDIDWDHFFDDKHHHDDDHDHDHHDHTFDHYPHDHDHHDVVYDSEPTYDYNPEEHAPKDEKSDDSDDKNDQAGHDHDFNDLHGLEYDSDPTSGQHDAPKEDADEKKAGGDDAASPGDHDHGQDHEHDHDHDLHDLHGIEFDSDPTFDHIPDNFGTVESDDSKGDGNDSKDSVSSDDKAAAPADEHHDFHDLNGSGLDTGADETKGHAAIAIPPKDTKSVAATSKDDAVLKVDIPKWRPTFF